jgi:tetratricopeptide (TPR) repeat protein
MNRKHISMASGAIGSLCVLACGFSAIQNHHTVATEGRLSLGIQIPREESNRRDAKYADADALEKDARRLLRQKDLPRAESVCRQALDAFKDDPHRTTVKRLLGEILLKKGEPAQAVAILTETEGHNDHEADLDIALCYVRLGDFARAKAYYTDQVVLSYVSNATARDLPGVSNMRSLEASISLSKAVRAYGHDLEGSLEDFETAGRLAPRNALVAHFHAFALGRLKRYDEAEKYLKVAAANDNGFWGQDAKKRLANFEQYRRTRHLREKRSRGLTPGLPSSEVQGNSPSASGLRPGP